MGDYNLKFTSLHFLLTILFFVLFHVAVRAQGDVCAYVECGQGKCVSTTSSILGYDCACDTGWKQFQLGPLTFPACVIPNCTSTIYSPCGNEEPSPSPPPPPPPPFPSSCSLVWCGEGTCIANGIMSYYCQCYDGSTNLLNMTALPCYKPCSLGVDCAGLGPGSHLTLPPPPPDGTSSAPPPPNDSNDKSKCSRSYVLNMSLLCASILALVHVMPYR